MVHSQSMLMEGILNSIPRRDHDHAGARADRARGARGSLALLDRFFGGLATRD